MESWCNAALIASATSLPTHSALMYRFVNAWCGNSGAKNRLLNLPKTIDLTSVNKCATSTKALPQS